MNDLKTKLNDFNLYRERTFNNKLITQIKKNEFRKKIKHTLGTSEPPPLQTIALKFGLTYNLLSSAAPNDKVFDLSQKLNEKKEKDLAQKNLEELNKLSPDSSNIKPETFDQLSKKREEKFLQSIEKEDGVWLHRFSDVRKDDSGFYILKSDNPAGSKIKQGDQLADYALNKTPYWQVSSISNDRINLMPINNNPFKTGIGAGGAKILQHDIDVYTGHYEKEKISHINDALLKGDVSIDLIKYILLGTVPVNFGPNGAQGGWYNVDDRSSRGGSQGKTPKQIMQEDAKVLKDHGVLVPLKALDGSMIPRKWNDWIEGNGSSFEPLPQDHLKDLEFTKKMVDKGKWRHSPSDLADLERKYDPKLREAYYDQMLKDVSLLSEAEWKAKYGWKEQNKAMVLKYFEWAEEAAKNAKEENELYLTEGETNEIADILKNVFSPERRIVNRNVKQLIQLCKEDSSKVKYLHDILKMGGAKDWLANEMIINFLNLIDDVPGLKLALTYLKDPTNLRYASNALYEQGESDYALEQLKDKTDNMELVGSLLYKLYSEYDNNKELRSKTFGRNDKLLNYVRHNNLVPKIVSALNSDDVQNSYYAGDAKSYILRSFGPTMDWEEGDLELVNALKNAQ